MKTKLMTVALVIVSLATSAFASCESTSAMSENRTVGTNFYGLILKSNARVILNQGTETSVRIEGDSKSVSSVETKIENGTLVIDGKNEIPVTIYVTMDDISLIEVNGPGNIFSNQVINSDLLLLRVVGNGSIQVDVRSLSLGMIVKGNGKIFAKGSTGDSFTRVFGNGQVVAMNLDSFKTTYEGASEKNLLKETNAGVSKNPVLKLHR